MRALVPRIALASLTFLPACGDAATEAAAPGTSDAAGQEAATWAPLFDGRTLDGWSGNTGHWSVEEGCLVGRTTADAPLARSVYLFHEVEAADFELEFEYLLRGGNSGMQYRSRRLPGGEVAGYQADLEAGPDYTGILYESAGRGIVATRGQRVALAYDGTRTVTDEAFGAAAALQEAVRADDWNRYRVVARGPLLVHEINGRRMVEVRDEQRGAARAAGLFAVQLHQGPPMEVRFRDLRLRRLPAEPLRRAEWVWAAAAQDGETRHFVHRFRLERPVTLQRGLITCDNAFEAWLDGAPFAAGDDWQHPVVVDGGLRLEAGEHLLAVRARNEFGPAGLVVELPWEDDDGLRDGILSSDAWWTCVDAPADWPRPAALPPDAVPAHSFGPVDRHRGPWGDLLAPRVATPAAAIAVPDGYRVTRVHSAERGEGSWASFTFADDGSAYVCGERGGLLRFRFPDGHDAPPRVERLDTPVVAAQGLEWVGDALYANVAGPADGNGGLHRLRDRDGDGVFEEHAHLAAYGPASEHGAHGIRLGPDGMLYTVQGNYTALPAALDRAASPHRHWAEDELLPRLWDPRGHAHGILAPGAVVLRTDLDGRRWELVAGGMRNPYDLDFSPDGELYTYDADMEWDVGAPWYRAPRVVHVVPGGESGWRSGTAKWPAAYPDSEPPVLETGPASPVGVRFGTGARFPAEMQRALFLGDWAYGRILAVRLYADGGGFVAQSREFVSGSPLPVTDLEIGPDGALWFTTGGRGAQSGLYRVEYVGAESTAPAAPAAPTADRLRCRALDAGDVAAAEVAAALDDDDRAVRAAARRLLEREPRLRALVAALHADGAAPGGTADRADALPPRARGELLLARVRTEAERFAPQLADELLAADFAGADEEQRWRLLRAAMLLHLRAPGDAAAWRGALALTARGWLEASAGTPALEREAAALAVALDPAGMPALLMPRFRAAAYPAARVHYALLLRLCADDWEPGDREELLTWLREWRGQPGGLSLAGYLLAIEQELLGALEPTAAAALAARLPEPAPPSYAVASRPQVRAWTLESARAELRAFDADGAPLPAEDGARLYRELGCIQCHRRGGEGGSVGPDLSGVGARFGREELLQAIVEPQSVQSDQYPWGAMPSGLADSLDVDELDALLRFLRSPAAR